MLTDKEIPNYFVKKGFSSGPIALNRTWTVLGANPCVSGEKPVNSSHSLGNVERERERERERGLKVGVTAGWRGFGVELPRR
jgi:hypothetical protein